MEILNLIALLSGLREDFLGLTLLAWGNSLGDFFANQALAKKGAGVMAVTGCFAGQFFNLVVGFGIALMNASSVRDIKFDLFNKNNFRNNGIKIFVLGFMLVNLLTTFTYLMYNDFKVEKKFSMYLIGYYVVFLLSVIAFQIADKAWGVESTV
jgi:solute carrier family 24 (sodium/potassium/calcium exchanger), member 6